MEMPRRDLDQRVIICVESAQDADRIISLLDSLNIEGVSCPNYTALCSQITQGAGAIIVSGPHILHRASDLFAALHAQPAWSAIPTIVITDESAYTAALPDDLPSGVTFLEQPIRIKTLLSIARIALSARHNQYLVRNLLHEREALVELLRNEAKMKNEFLATLAHELRNPLAPIRTGLQIIRMSSASNTTIKTLEMMERQVRHLVRLIDDLLDISRITRGKLEIRKQKVSLNSLLSDAVEASKPLIEAGHHTLTIAAPEELITLDVDPTRIAQVISNLLNNAAKYTPPGGVITLTARHNVDSIQIEVKDNGIGLSQEMLTKIFDMFLQVEPSTPLAQGGLGIGLSLARRLTEMHDGTVEATSAGPGKGSAFTITLPCKAPTHTNSLQPTGAGSSSPAYCGKAHRVLVVDDQIDVAQSFKDLLSLLGQETRTAYNGPDALQTAQEFKPELIFLDIGLPGMTGYEVAQTLRAQKDTPPATLIAVTGWGDEDNIALAKQAGFDRHLTKPVDPLEIERILETL
jgi:signal transduction histidine kinase